MCARVCALGTHAQPGRGWCCLCPARSSAFYLFSTLSSLPWLVMNFKASSLSSPLGCCVQPGTKAPRRRGQALQPYTARGRGGEAEVSCPQRWRQPAADTRHRDSCWHCHGISLPAQSCGGAGVQRHHCRFALVLLLEMKKT